MSNLQLDIPMVVSWKQVADYLEVHPQAVWRPSPEGVSFPIVTIGHNTTLADMGHNILEVCYHHNPIIHYSPYEIGLTCAGWNTITTRDRLNKLQPVRVRSDYPSDVLGIKTDRRKVAWFAGKTIIDPARWYSFPWPPIDIVDNPEALAEWGRTVEAMEG